MNYRALLDAVCEATGSLVSDRANLLASAQVEVAGYQCGTILAAIRIGPLGIDMDIVNEARICSEQGVCFVAYTHVLECAWVAELLERPGGVAIAAERLAAHYLAVMTTQPE